MADARKETPEQPASVSTTKSEATSNGDEPKNALQDNIARKGQNAYYYAHTKSEENDTVYNFGGQPMKLEVTDEDTSTGVVDKRKEKKIAKYSWADGKKSVKIYLEHECVDAIGEDSIKLIWEKESIKLTLIDPSANIDHVLDFPKLHDEIEEATYVKKTGSRLVLNLKKANHATWYQLTSK